MPKVRKHTVDEALQRLERVQGELHQLTDVAESGILAGLVAHEVRNLLTPAIAYAQLALRDNNTPSSSARDALERCCLAMRRAAEVSELILSDARGDSSASANPPTVSSVITDCIEALGWDKPPFQLQVDVPPDLQTTIPSDALRHVLLNLMLNARSALPPSGGSISIEGSTWSNEDHGPQRIMISVVDNGRGIDPFKLQQIQATLAQSGLPRARSHSGLGLILCNKLLAANGAHLRIESTPNEGTVAVVSLRAAA